MASIGISENIFRRKLETRFGKAVVVETKELTVNVSRSATGDHYIEFGGNARAEGERRISGLLVR